MIDGPSPSDLAGVYTASMTNNPRSGSLFISYARGDDEPFVKRLHDDLDARGFPLWWDRKSMPNRGLTFLREIRDAINDAERLLFVLGPRALDSDYVRAEWQYACSIGTPVVTVLRLADYKSLPDALGHFDVIDFRSDDSYATRLETLVRQLEQPVAPLGKVVGVPELPPQFQARPDDIAAIRQALLRDSREPVVLTAAGRRAGMQGMGGIGKSVLAAAVAREFDVRRAFPDGLVWLPLGTNPNLPLRLAQACTAFGDAPQTFYDSEQGRARLGELLADRAALLLLDDAWQLDHVRAFDATGPRSALFVTTRDERLLDEMGATKHRLDVLSPEDALRLMATWLAAPERVVAKPDSSEHQKKIDEIVGTIADEANLVARECGYLPLALALSAAQVRDGMRWSSLLEALREADLQYLDHPNGSIFASIKTSVDALGSENAAFAKHYVELAVFPQSARVPESALMTLWQRRGGLSERMAEKLLATLARRAMLTVAGDAPHRRIQLHDLQHDFVRAANDDLKSLHETLLDAYRQKFTGDWPEGPDDGYFFQYLGYHLDKAGRADELYTLLTRSPAWMEAQFKACTGDTRFVANLDRVLERTSIAQRPVEHVALMAARQVVHERVAAYSDSVLETLTLIGRSGEALSQARLRPEPATRVNGLVRIYRSLADQEQRNAILEEALGLVPQIPTDYRGQGALDHLALLLFEAGRTAEALSVSSNQSARHSSSYSRNPLVKALEERELFSEATAVARTISQDDSRVSELLNVAEAARKTKQPEIVRAIVAEATTDLRAIVKADSPNEVNWRTGLFQKAAELLGNRDPQSSELWRDALDAILVPESRGSTYYLDPLMVKLARVGETELILKAFSTSPYSEMRNGDAARPAVSAALEATLFDTALAIARIINEPDIRAETLAEVALAMRRAGDGRDALIAAEVFALADHVERGRGGYAGDRVRTFCKIAEALNGIDAVCARDLVDRALNDVRYESDPYLGGPESLMRVQQTMIRIGLVDEARPILDEAFANVAEGRGSYYNLAAALAEIGDVDRALIAARKVENDWLSPIESVAKTLAQSGHFQAALKTLDSIVNQDSRDSVLADVAVAIAPHDPVVARDCFERALQNRSWPLRFVISHIVRAPQCWTDELLEVAVSSIEHIEKPEERIEIIREFFPKLLAARRTRNCDQLLGLARKLGVNRDLDGTLTEEFEKFLDDDDFEGARLALQNIESVHGSSGYAVRLAALLAERGDLSALEVARTVRGQHRAQALEAVALAYAKKGERQAVSILEEALALNAQAIDRGASDAAIKSISRAFGSLNELDALLVAIAAVVAPNDRVNALAENAPALFKGNRLDGGLTVANAIDSPLIRARALLVLGTTADDRALIEKGLSEAETTDASEDDDAASHLIHELCETAVKYSSSDEKLARILFEASKKVCSLISDQGVKTGRQALISHAFARAGWFSDALVAARAVEDGPQFSFGHDRSQALASIAQLLAIEGRAEEALAAADEADGVVVESVMSAASIAAMLPPDDYATENRRRIEELLAQHDEKKGARSSEPQADSVKDWREALKVQGLEKFLIALGDCAAELEREAPGTASAAIKEATRIAGWRSSIWRAISEALDDTK